MNSNQPRYTTPGARRPASAPRSQGRAVPPASSRRTGTSSRGTAPRRPVPPARRASDVRPKRLPFWLYVAAAQVYMELLLLTLGGKDGSGMSWFYAILTGAATGTVLGVIATVIADRRWRKGISIAVLGLPSVVFCVQYFVLKSYQNYMNLSDIISGVGGVLTGFTGTFFSTIFRGLWAILLFFLPLIGFLVFERRLDMRRLREKDPLVLIGGALVLQALCIGVIALHPVDRYKLVEEYKFDSAVHTFGLNNACYLDAINSLGGKDSTDFHYDDPSTADDPSVDTDPVSTDTEDGGQTAPEPIVYGKNEMPIDFEALAASEKKESIANIHSYIASQTPSSQNEFTGLFKGKNLILITAEAFSKEVIDPERTPTLYRLATKGIQFTDYYQPAWGGSTSTGEYSVLMGLVPTNGVKSIKDTIGHNLYLTMGNQLDRLGYTSYAFHDGSYTYYGRNQTHENFGYSQFIGMGNGMEEGVKQCWPESDLEMMQWTLELYKNKQPFSVYYMTVSGHCLYNWAGNSMSKRNRDVMETVDASETIKAYYAANYELEKALTYLVEQLEAMGIADDTVIALSTDHYPYGLEKSETWGTDKDYLAELYGYEASDCFKRDHSALILWSGCLEDREEPIVVDTPTYSLDILPTLSNLFGVTYDSRLLVGRDVFSDAEPLVIWGNYTWMSDKGTYDSRNGTFTPFDGVTVPEDYVKRIKSIVGNKINFSKSVLTYDYYNTLFK